MSQKSSGPLSKFNLALALLWLVDVAVTVAGYLILTSSNASQAEFYTNQSADYVTYFSAQSGSTLGATLIAAGVLGFIITLAAHVVSRAITRASVAGVPTDTVDESDVDVDDSEFDADDLAAFETDSTDTTGAATTDVVEPTPAAASADTTPADARFSNTDADSTSGRATTR